MMRRLIAITLLLAAAYALGVVVGQQHREQAPYIDRGRVYPEPPRGPVTMPKRRMSAPCSRWSDVCAGLEVVLASHTPAANKRP